MFKIVEHKNIYTRTCNKRTTYTVWLTYNRETAYYKKHLALEDAIKDRDEQRIILDLKIEEEKGDIGIIPYPARKRIKSDTCLDLFNFNRPVDVTVSYLTTA